MEEVVDRSLQSDVEFNVVFTDLTMPGMNGIKLAQDIYACRPDLPVILMTGYAKEMVF